MAFRSISSNNVPSSTLSVTPPAGIQNGDVLVMWTTSDDSAGTLTFPAGFTKLTGSPRSSTIDGMTLEAAWKIAASESGSYQVSSSTPVIGAVACFSGIDTGTLPYRQSNGQSSVNNDSPWSMTTAAFSSNTDVTCDLVFIGASDGPGTPVHSGPSGYTIRADIASGIIAGALSSQDAVASGVTGADSMIGTDAGHAAGWGAFHIALKNSGGGSPPAVSDPSMRNPLFNMLIRM